jgi:uncharacterized protein YjbI with pentapeptide repeats
MNNGPERPAAAQPSSDAAEKLEAAKIKRVDDLSALARTAWFTLLGALAFVAVTLLSIEHPDVLIDKRMIDLPVVSVQVPTRLFLALGPIALTVLYFNLHLYLLKLWQAFRYAPVDRPATQGGDQGWRLADRIQPWLVNDYALTLKHGAGPRDHNRAFLRNGITWLTVWAATPAVLGWMWCKSLLVREPAITGPILICLALTLALGSHSWLDARRQLGDPAVRPPRPLANAATALVAGLMLLAGYATWAAFKPVPASVASAAGDVPAGTVAQAGVASSAILPIDGRLQRLLDIDDEDVAGVAGSVAPFAAHREEYRQTWCEIAAVPLDLCAKPPAETDLATNGLIVARQRHCLKEKIVLGLESYRKCNAWFGALDRRFEADWLGVRMQALAKIARVELGGMQLSGMSAVRANLTRVDLEGADLSGATMARVTLEGATLKGANLDGADANNGNLELANLTGAGGHRLNLQSAHLAGASLRGADLSAANLSSADLTGAKLTGADLTGADLRRARLTLADLDGAILTDARLEGAIGLGYAQIATAVGSERTAFGVSNRIDDEGTLAREAFKVDDCWKALPRAIETLKADFEGEAANFPEFRQRLGAYEPHLCPSREPALVGESIGQRLYLPESNVDRRVPAPEPWPPGEARKEPKIALPWLIAEPDPEG